MTKADQNRTLYVVLQMIATDYFNAAYLEDKEFDYKKLEDLKNDQSINRKNRKYLYNKQKLEVEAKYKRMDRFSDLCDEMEERLYGNPNESQVSEFDSLRDSLHDHILQYLEDNVAFKQSLKEEGNGRI